MIRALPVALGLSLLAVGCGGEAGLAEAGLALAEPGDCRAPAAGCPCDGELPVACAPAGAPELEAAGLCQEGRRHCRAGRWSACEGVRSFAPADAPTTAVVDQLASHPQCSDCDRACFVVVDTMDPGVPLQSSFADNVDYFRGGGLSIQPEDGLGPPDPPDPADLPPGELLLIIPIGQSGAIEYSVAYWPAAVDVYFLLDMSVTAGLAWQALHDAFDGGTLLGAEVPCASGTPEQVDGGVVGAVRCMVPSSAFGVGMLRDIPFLPYAGTDVDYRRELPFSHHQSIDLDPGLTHAAFASLGGPQDAGDRAASQIPALHSVATGAGAPAGVGRSAVPTADSCAGDDFGYPCFRAESDPIVLLVTDNPGHNASPASGLDYDLSLLQIPLAEPTVTALLPTNDTPATAHHLTDTAEGLPRIFEGSTSELGARVPPSEVGCGADAQGKDAVFTFGVDAGGEPTVPVRLSTVGSGFPAALSVHSGEPATGRVIQSDDDNEWAPLALDIGDIYGQAVEVEGSTRRLLDPAGPMDADYQGSLLGRSCHANSVAPDAVYRFDVDGASGPVTMDLELTMGGRNPVVAVFEDSQLPARWPRVVAPLQASGNSSTLGDAFEIPVGAGQPYVSVVGDLGDPDIASDFSAATVGGGQCHPADEAHDVVFRFTLAQGRLLRFDTEGSSLDTVLSLHDTAPLTKAGGMIEHLAADTHRDLNEDPPRAWATGAINGLDQTWHGDTSTMTADLAGDGGCGFDEGCADAVYRVRVDERSAFRMEATSDDFEAAISITRGPPTGVPGGYAALAAGTAHTCARSSGVVYCWGSDADGQLGDGGGTGGTSTAARAVTLPALATQVSAGLYHTCATTVTGAVYCWGRGTEGQLGDGAATSADAPVAVADLGNGPGDLGFAVQVATGRAHSCALLGDGRVVCWGHNGRDQLGTSSAGNGRDVPIEVGGGHLFTQIAANQDHSCAIRQGDGALFCWGAGDSGKLGDGAASDRSSPTRAGSLEGVRHVMTGLAHTCAVLGTGRVYCWGAGADGRLGQGADTSNHYTPMPVLDPDGSGSFLGNARAGWAAGGAHSCVATLEGFVLCWGDNGVRQLGDGTNSDRGLPVAVSGILDAVQVVSSRHHSCALERGGTARCWGAGGSGQLGDGTLTVASDPVPMQPAPGGVAFGDGGLDRSESLVCGGGGTAPEPGCTRTFDTQQDRAYFICPAATRTWAEAGLVCQEAGLQLASPDSAGEWDVMRSLLAGTAGRTWLGVKRETSDDWYELDPGLHFETVRGRRIWTTTQAYRDRILWPDLLSEGYFNRPPAPAELVDSYPAWDSQSTWESAMQPNPEWGYNCVSADQNGKWRSEFCSAIAEEPDCGFLGWSCLLDDVVAALFGVIKLALPFLGELDELLDSNAGLYSSPHLSGGDERGYMCELADPYVDVLLDPGDYWVSVKGADDGIDGNTCEGAYQLRIADLGTADGGFIACSDDGDVDGGAVESGASSITRWLDPGTYYLVLKGKQAADTGPYVLNVRDVQAVPDAVAEACDAGVGEADPATASFVAEPGRSYYAFVKGDRPGDADDYRLRFNGPPTNRIACDADSGADGNAEVTVDLATGNYYAVLKGRDGGAGDYALSVGTPYPPVGTYMPPTYDAAVTALTDASIRVGTVLWCDPGDPACEVAEAQWSQLATDTDGTLMRAMDATEVPAQAVEAVRTLERLDTVTASVQPPFPAPAFSAVDVAATVDPAAQCATSAGQTFIECAPGAAPTFSFGMTHPPNAPVPPSDNPWGTHVYQLTVEGRRDGDIELAQTVPVHVFPDLAAPPGSYRSGVYHQSVDARACDAFQAATQSAFLPSWEHLSYDAYVFPETAVHLSVCTADQASALEGCESGSTTASGYRRLVTLSAGSGAGTLCTQADEAIDCPGGYCSPYTGACVWVEGEACTADEDCPGALPGSCRAGPSAATLGTTCGTADREVWLAATGWEGNYRPHARIRADLESRGDGSRTPILYEWQLRYRCVQVE